MLPKETIQQRFNELSQPALTTRFVNGFNWVENQGWGRWSTSALNLLELVFGTSSACSSQLRAIVQKEGGIRLSEFERALGIFQAAKTDYEKGCYGSLERAVFGEVFSDFIAAAKNALSEGNKDVAAVLACAALEDALKRFANANGLNSDGKDMSEVIGALKSKSLVGGAQKGILDSMPKTRNNAMHADWSKISSTEVGGVIGFTEQFLIQNF